MPGAHCHVRRVVSHHTSTAKASRSEGQRDVIRSRRCCKTGAGTFHLKETLPPDNSESARYCEARGRGEGVGRRPCGPLVDALQVTSGK